MKVRIKLYKSYHQYIDKDITINEGIIELELEKGTSIRKLINYLNIPEEEVKIIMVNSRPKTLDSILNDEDYIFIFPPVAGG